MQITDDVPKNTDEIIDMQLEDDVDTVVIVEKLSAYGRAEFKLSKLKFIDLSYNVIESISEEFKNLIHLNTLVLSNNCIKEFAGLSDVPLHTLDLSNNQISKFPDVSKDILELKLNINEITDIPDNVDQLKNLKLLDLNENKIESVPKSLGSMAKLKDLHLRGNPIKDKRLLKLVDQCHHKSIADYIKKNGRDPKKEETIAEENKVKVSEAKQNSKTANRIIIHKYDENRGFKIYYSVEVKEIRPFIICCLVRNVTFTQSSFQKFLNLQTKIHESDLCGRRENATLGTHDFDQIKSNYLKYTARPKNQIKIVPLGRNSEVSADKYFDDLKQEVEAYRKEKKRGTLTGVYKYLGLLKGDNFVYIEDGDGQVLSLPPLTNSEASKVISFISCEIMMKSHIIHFLFSDFLENQEHFY
jgi:hypothetical protein